MAEHTPTPWVLDRFTDTTIEIVGDNGDLVDITPLDGAVAPEARRLKADALRKIAVMNAFHSDSGREIPTDKITPGLVFEMADELREAHDKLAAFIAEHIDPGAHALALQYRLRALLAKLEDKGQ